MKIKMKKLLRPKRSRLNEVSQTALDIHKSFKTVTDSDNFKYGMKSISKLLPSNRRLFKLEGDVLNPKVKKAFKRIRNKLEEIGADENKTFETGIVEWLEEPNEYAMRKSNGRAKAKIKKISLNRFFRKFKLDKDGWFKRFMDSKAYQTWKTNRDGSGYLLMTRHPIDIMKMSDHVVTNCHTEGQAFFHCAISEAVGSNGFMVYNISDEDAQWIQENFNNESFANDEILYDKKRGFNGIKTQGMTRVRRLASKDFKHNVYTWSKFYSDDHNLRSLTERELTKFLITNQQEGLEWLKTADKNEIKLVGGAYEDLSLHDLVQNVGIENDFGGIENRFTFGTPDLDQKDVRKEVEKRGELLIDAIKELNFEKVKELVEDGADINFNSNQPLGAAIESRQLKIADLLLNHGANIEDSESLTYAMRKKYHEGVDFLLQQPTLSDEFGLQLANAVGYKNEKVINHLLSNNLSKDPGGTALRLAVKYENEKVINHLLSNNLSKDPEGRALKNAVIEENEKVINHLLSNNLSKDPEGRALENAMEYENEKVINHLLSNNLSKDPEGKILAIAVEEENEEVINHLLSNNLSKDPRGIVLKNAVEYDNEEVINFLFKDEKTSYNKNAILSAIMFQHSYPINKLLAYFSNKSPKFENDALIFLITAINYGDKEAFEFLFNTERAGDSRVIRAILDDEADDFPFIKVLKNFDQHEGWEHYLRLLMLQNSKKIPLAFKYLPENEMDHLLYWALTYKNQTALDFFQKGGYKKITKISYHFVDIILQKLLENHLFDLAEKLEKYYRQKNISFDYLTNLYIDDIEILQFLAQKGWLRPKERTMRKALKKGNPEIVALLLKNGELDWQSQGQARKFLKQNGMLNESRIRIRILHSFAR